MLTLPEVQQSLPVQHRNNITQGMVDQLNNLSNDPEEARCIRDNFVSFSSVLSEGRYKIGDYVRAVMYVSHKIMDRSNLDAYKLTFPDRYSRMVANNKATKDIASVVAAYNKGQLVCLVTEAAIVPSWVLNQGMFQEALNTQYTIMQDVDASDRVRVEAANSILTHLKKPDIHKAELKVDISMSDGMKELEGALIDVSRRQKNMIEHDPNTSANDIAALPMITRIDNET